MPTRCEAPHAPVTGSAIRHQLICGSFIRRLSRADHSFTAKASDQELNESRRINAHSHMHVRLNRVDAHGFQPIAPRNHTIYRVPPIADGFAACKLAVSLYIDAHLLRL